jgi:hypothetical protein
VDEDWSKRCSHGKTKKRFPSLIEQAQQKVSRMTTVGELNELYLELISVTDEPAARKLLTS